MEIKISEIAHVNIVVSNMENSLAFYKDTLGFEVVLDKEINSPGFSRGVGLKDARARVVILKPSSANTLLELFEYRNPSGEKLGPKPPNTTPIFHVAFRVDDIFGIYNTLKSCSVEFIESPQEASDGVFFCYLRDPDGALVELIQFP